MKRLDHSARIQVFRGIRKVAWNPVSICQGGCGKPLETTMAAPEPLVQDQLPQTRTSCLLQDGNNRIPNPEHGGICPFRGPGVPGDRQAAIQGRHVPFQSIHRCFFYPLEKQNKPPNPRGFSPSESDRYPSGHSYWSPKAPIYLNPRLPFHVLLPSSTIHTREKASPLLRRDAL